MTVQSKSQSEHPAPEQPKRPSRPAKAAAPRAHHARRPKTAPERARAQWPAPDPGAPPAGTRVVDHAARHERNEKIKELIKYAEAQGYLTYDDINEILPDSVIKPEELESYFNLLRGMDIEIVDSADVDKSRRGAPEEKKGAKEPKLDFFDDPIRMYLHQMGQVPLLTREQEVEICKRIEKAETTVRQLFNQMGFAARMYLDLTERIEKGQERLDRVVVDKFVDSRDRYLRVLPRLKRELNRAHANLARTFLLVRRSGSQAARARNVRRLAAARGAVVAPPS